MTVTTPITGGCKCGAIRYESSEAPLFSGICCCRNCQYMTGTGQNPLIGVPNAGFRVTKGEPRFYEVIGDSGKPVRHAFCADCGTPLSFEAPDGDALSIAAFDDPAAVVPTIQWGIEAKLPYVDQIPSLPGKDTLEDVEAQSFIHELVSYQHPDYDTETWPPQHSAGKTKA